jgi:prepilin-type N-terminal cleavage/methylation domain-containing protein
MNTAGKNGFTLIEVMIAASIMIILAVGTLAVFSHAARINAGNNMRSQAQSVLQQEIEYYRSLRFVPGAETTADLSNHRSADLYAGTVSRPARTSSDGQVFNMSVTITNLTPSTEERLVRYKEIRITATPVIPEGSRPGWLSDANLRTDVTFQRVRAN